MRQLPTWVIALMAVAAVLAAVGLAYYLQKAWPLKALFWLEDVADALAGSKVLALAKLAVFIGGGAAALWAGLGAVRRWLRPSNDRS